MDVAECQACSSYNTFYSGTTIQKGKIGAGTNIGRELWIPAHCADCGYSWWIVYVADSVEER